MSLLFFLGFLLRDWVSLHFLSRRLLVCLQVSSDPSCRLSSSVKPFAKVVLDVRFGVRFGTDCVLGKAFLHSISG